MGQVKVTKEYAEQLAEQGLTPLMDFAHESPRGYRGEVSGRDGHNGARSKNGTWAPQKVNRKRWTTALQEPALDSLHALAKKYGLRRCEIAEILLMAPEADEIVARALPRKAAS